MPEQPTPADTLEAAKLFKQLLALQEGSGVENALLELLAPLAKALPALPEGEDFGLWVSVVERLANPAAVIDAIVRTALVCPLPRLSQTVRSNLLLASGIDPENPTRKALVMPTMVKEAAPISLVQSYLRGTPFVDFFCTPYPFTIPAGVRFEHTHIVGGSGHGKTQLLQTLVLRDLDALSQGQGSLIVIDSQGDMIRTISHLAAFSPAAQGSLADRLVLITLTTSSTRHASISSTSGLSGCKATAFSSARSFSTARSPSTRTCSARFWVQS